MPCHGRLFEKHGYVLKFKILQLAVSDLYKMHESNFDPFLKNNGRHITSLIPNGGILKSPNISLIIGPRGLERKTTYWKSANLL